VVHPETPHKYWLLAAGKNFFKKYSGFGNKTNPQALTRKPLQKNGGCVNTLTLY
jgi:hypothetical protein